MVGTNSRDNAGARATRWNDIWDGRPSSRAGSHSRDSKRQPSIASNGPQPQEAASVTSAGRPRNREQPNDNRQSRGFRGARPPGSAWFEGPSGEVGRRPTSRLRRPSNRHHVGDVADPAGHVVVSGLVTARQLDGADDRLGTLAQLRALAPL